MHKRCLETDKKQRQNKKKKNSIIQRFNKSNFETENDGNHVSHICFWLEITTTTTKFVINN